MTVRNSIQNHFPMFSSYAPVDLQEVERLVSTVDVGQLSGDRLQQLAGIVSVMDLTTLDSSDTPEKVEALCRKGMDPHSDLPTVAAICVFPNFVSQARVVLTGSGVGLASVAGAFPHGQTALYLKGAEVQFALEQGADEIDMVISRGQLKSGLYSEVFDEIAAIRERCSTARLKVILETGELNPDQIRIASDIALYAGADFIKTSTGKIPVGATLHAAAIMLTAIRDYHAANGIAVGFKASGGISTTEHALQYMALAKGILGETWLNKELFRFGASSLLDDVLRNVDPSLQGIQEADY